MDYDAVPTEAPTLPFERVSLTDAGRVQHFFTVMLGQAPTVEQAIERLEEEMDELADAIDFIGLGCCGDDDCPCGDNDPKDDEHLLKELCDVLFTLHGLALAKGYNLTEAFKRVCDSNLTKMPAVGSTTKIAKGPGYVEPTLDDLI